MRGKRTFPSLSATTATGLRQLASLGRCRLQTGPMASVFLSYAREDASAAEALARALEAAEHQVWWDRRLSGGAEFTREIEQALEQVDAVVVLWSKSSVHSAWVRDEAELGRDSLRLIPASIDGVQAPLGFRQYQTIDLTDWLASKDGAPRELLKSLAAKAEGRAHARGEEPRGEDEGHILHQEVQFCSAPDGTGLAFSVVGEGPPLVKTANWLNHLELEWDSPIWRHWIRELSRRHTLLRYDERGNGMSDRDVPELSLDAFVEDLETVVNAAGLDEFDLVGISQGAAVSVAYAVRYPERVRRLVLYGGFPGGRHEDTDLQIQWKAMYTLAGVGWGKNNPAFRQVFTSLYYPNGTPEEVQAFNELQRVSASPEEAQRLMRVLGQLNVQDLLPKVQVPTLVIHSRGDAMVPFEEGRFMATKIPGARFVALESENHLLPERDPEWPKVQRLLRSFLA
ncbi:MAG TPA: alpha/beta fold hydrolase [Allosphingosinicella sp.]|nr:alpha/beta fold hydrolase [Allosphingosinicella sp.]